MQKRSNSREQTISGNLTTENYIGQMPINSSKNYKMAQFLNKINESNNEANRSSYERKKYDQVLSKISYLDLEKPPEERKYNYSYEGLLPYVFFFKYLAPKPSENFSSDNLYTRLKLWLPDTIVLNERNDLPPMWFYTSEDGYVYRTDSFTIKNAVTKLTNYASPEELVAVLKKVCINIIMIIFNLIVKS